MKLLITGGAGFVMSTVACHVLHHTDWELALAMLPGERTRMSAVLDRFSERVSVVELDVTRATAGEWDSAVSSVDAVVHGAAVSPSTDSERRAPQRFFDVNVIGTVALLQALNEAKRKTRLVHVSSVAVYGDGGGSQFSHEDSCTGPLDLYDISKFAAEASVRRMCELYDIQSVVLRLTRVFGRREHPTMSRPAMSLPYRVAQSIASGEPLQITPRSLLSAADWLPDWSVADAVVRALTGPTRNRVFNVANGRLTPVREVLAIASSVDSSFKYVEGHSEDAFDLDPRALVGKDGTFSVQAIEAGLGWRPPNVSTALRSYFEWAAHQIS